MALKKAILGFLGYYLMCEATGMDAGEIARVYSPEVHVTTVHCLSLYYTLYGRNVERLTIYKYLGNNLITTIGNVLVSENISFQTISIY